MAPDAVLAQLRLYHKPPPRSQVDYEPIGDGPKPIFGADKRFREVKGSRAEEVLGIGDDNLFEFLLGLEGGLDKLPIPQDQHTAPLVGCEKVVGSRFGYIWSKKLLPTTFSTPLFPL